MEGLSQVLAEATASIEFGYFRLNIDGGDPIYRERVYCYELYHQMRLHWPSDCPFCLNGEIDKAAHPILTQLGAGHAKPDLLIHQPGYMRGNLAIIEVKSVRAADRGILKDVETLSLFINRVGYQRAIFLMYGDGDADRLFDRVSRIASLVDGRAPIELWLHREAGEAASCIGTLQP